MSLTDSQLDDILATIENNPLAVDPDAPTIPIDIDSFSREFNGRLQPVMKRIFGKDARLIAMIEQTFLMDDTGRVQTDELDFLPTFFADRAALFLSAAPDGGNIRLITFAYTRAQSQTETVSINLIMATILSIVLPSVKDPAPFIDKKFRAASFTKDGVNVSFSRLGKVFLMTVEAT